MGNKLVVGFIVGVWISAYCFTIIQLHNPNF
jgi:hypothetical protein